MTDEIEAIGTAVEGTMLGKAIEGNKGEPEKDGISNESRCLNCSTVLSGTYCHQCGQKADIHRSLSAIWHDILHGVLHFDGKLWRTLPMLAFRPGELTRRYIQGERANFVSPMALFLFAIFLMFAIFSFTGDPANVSSANSVDKQMTEQGEILEQQIAEKTRKLEKIEKLKPGEQAKLKGEIIGLKTTQNNIAYLQGKEPVYNDIAGAKDGPPTRIDSSTGFAPLDRAIEVAAYKANKNPDLILYKLKSNGYKFAWLLIPLSLPFIWLVTLGVRGHHFYDHAIFVTYSISFMSLLFIAASLSDRWGLGGWAWTIFLTVSPWHLYRQLKNSYELSRFSAIIRLLFLFVSIGMVMLLFFHCLLALGLLG